MTNAKVLVSDKLSESGLAVLKAASGIDVDYKPGLSEDELADAIGKYDGLIIRSGSKVTAKVLERAEQLRVIGRAGIGVDNVDVPVASRRGVIVMNTPTGNAVTTAEHALTLLMSLARRIPQASASTKSGKWEKSKFQGSELANKTLGIIGMGNIGRIVADRAQGLKMKVIAFDPVLNKERAASLGVELVDLAELYPRADFITIHAPLTPETKALINATSLGKMKKGVLIVNAARGGIVDEQALAEAVESGQVGGAALDVFVKEPVPADNPVLKVDGIVVTPHLGASTSEAQERVATEICEQVVDYLQTGTIKNAVNVPALPGEAAEKLAPYLETARKLGKLLGQLEPVNAQEFRVTVSGRPGEFGARPLAAAALAGYLERYVEGTVSTVSAPFEAKERGIQVVEVHEDTPRRFTNSVKVTVSGDNGEQSAVGALGATGQPLLGELNDYDLEASLEGNLMLMQNDDRPGVIGAVGMILGKREINVSRMQVSSTKNEALALWNVDQEVPDDALEELRALPNVRSVLLVKL